MSKFIINKSKPLKGKVRVSGAKNAILPIMAASLLADGTSCLSDIPNLNDVIIMGELLESLGANINFNTGNMSLKIEPSLKMNAVAPYDLVNKLRASFLVMGPMLAKTGYAKISLPGGCPIGSRPVDLHLKGFQALGAEISQDHGYIEAKSKGKLKGNKIYLDFPSVGATENIIMAAVLAEGETIIENSAVEPEIADLANFLKKAGAAISGEGTDTIRIIGTDSLKSVEYTVIPDRIEAGTYMVAAALTGGDIIIDNVRPEHLTPVSAKLKEAGIEIAEELSILQIKSNKEIKAVDIKTLPYPGFPTDMQAQITALLSVGKGTSMIIETIFENRFMYVNELKRMGANIKIDGRTAIVEGGPVLTGAEVKATDLRAGAALVLAGLAADGVTTISDIQHIERGYDQIDKKLNALGADILKIEE